MNTHLDKLIEDVRTEYTSTKKNDMNQEFKLFMQLQNSVLGGTAGTSGTCSKIEVERLHSWLEKMLEQVRRDKESDASFEKRLDNLKIVYVAAGRELMRLVSLASQGAGELLEQIWNGYYRCMELELLKQAETQKDDMERMKRDFTEMSEFAHLQIEVRRQKEQEVLDVKQKHYEQDEQNLRTKKDYMVSLAAHRRSA